jgi:hypothetical protein
MPVGCDKYSIANGESQLWPGNLRRETVHLFARMVDVSFGTLRVQLIIRRQKVLVALTGFGGFDLDCCHEPGHPRTRNSG